MEVEDEVAELLVSSRGRGGGSGCGGARRRTAVRSGARERDPRKGVRARESEREAGRCVAPSGRVGEKAASRTWPGRRRRSPRLASVLLAREEDDREEAVMGWAVGAGPVGGRQVSPGGFSLSFFLFSIFCNWF